jgi:FkbM family methyltransferase
MSGYGDNSIDATFVSQKHLDKVGFSKTSFAAKLEANPISLLDVGARWGVNPLFHAFAPYIAVTAFEPDEGEVENIAEEECDIAWAGLEVLGCALGRENGKLQLNVLQRANNSSVFPVDPHMYERYSLKGFELASQENVEAYSLDSLVSKKMVRNPCGEVIKLDTQGAELLILEGAKKCLNENTCCVITEAAFFTPYVGACSFSDVEQLLTSLGFSFYGFVNFKFRSTRRLDKSAMFGRERMMQADAIFFKDPFATDINGVVDERQAMVLFIMSLLYGYFDFSLELLDRSECFSSEKDVLTELVHLAASSKLPDIHSEVKNLEQSIADNPADALVLLGKYIDNLRDFQSFHDILLEKKITEEVI